LRVERFTARTIAQVGREGKATGRRPVNIWTS
jgi:hypothetical protein